MRRASHCKHADAMAKRAEAKESERKRPFCTFFHKFFIRFDLVRRLARMAGSRLAMLPAHWNDNSILFIPAA